MGLPDTMRAAVLHAPGDLRIEERPRPTPAYGEVLVQVAAVGVCGSDTHYFEHGRIGEFVVRAPLVLGHESAGRIVAVGADVPADRIGQRVSVEPGVPCRRCHECRHGRYNLCPDVRFFGTPPIDGAFCEYVTVPADFAHPVPDGVSDEAAGLIEPMSVGIWACRKGSVAPGSRVLVAGAGPIGLVTAQAARVFGAAEVIVTDVSEARLAVAGRFGATGTVLAGTPLAGAENATAGGGFDVFVDCSGAPAAVTAGLRSVRRAGTAVLVGMGADEVPIPVDVVQRRELTLTGTFRYANTWPLAIRLAATGRIDLDGLVTDRYPLDDAAAAMRPKPDGEERIKAVVLPQLRAG
ncbi:NAD(P)-dependent alcohol dehydrogenase [Actinocatenispora rupis]|uniref:Sorbitol dehydrogenase n=1 Tax=Actinocatenispora rupis TaxID=519421 RepID=A0A8J3NFJ9_9ACTN|nr:NAD(P)-dependent alcohol dehydrogenase [Actinocatenispora rupis]GID14960.1 sorbitol dehydrogenase [Actinocatenispora rupis]